MTNYFPAAGVSRSLRPCRVATIIGVVALAWGSLVPLREICHGAEYVIHISVDGLRPFFLQNLIDAGNAPNFKRLQDEGAWTSNARTDYSHTITLPNHTSMLTGRPVSQPAGMPNTTHHGYTSNGTPSSTTTLHNSGNLNVPYKASTFDVVHDAGLSTALYASKNKFVLYDQSYNDANGAENVYGRDKIDTYFVDEDPAPSNALTMHNQLLADAASDPANYTFVHYANADSAGHAHGWGSTSYLNAVAIVDGYLGSLLDLIDNNETLAGHTAIVLSADHGGSGNGHSTSTSASNYTIPFFVWGAGVGHGDLYAFNSATRTDPGATRPTYTQVGQPIRNGDGGNLALSLLGLGPIPGSLINAEQNLRVTMPGDYNQDGAIDAGDYTRWRDTLGQNVASGTGADGNGDGTISDADYTVWKSHFGNDAASSSTASVPEPATYIVVIIALLVVRLRR